MALKLALRISDDLERSRFLSLFEIMAPRLTDKWEIADTTHADVVVFDANEPGGEFFLSTCRRSVGALPMAYGKVNTLNAEWFLSKPVRVNSFIPLLNKAASHIKHNQGTKRNTGSNTDPKMLKLSDKLDALAGDNPLAALISQASETPSAAFFSNPRLPKLYYAPETQTLYAPPEILIVSSPFKRLRALNTLDIGQIYPVEINNSSLQNAVKKDALIAVSLDVALWASTLHLSEGHLPKGMSADETFQLVQMPDFGRLPHTAAHEKMAAELVSAPSNINKTARKLGIPLASVVDFVNACRSLDLIKVGAADIVADEEKDKPEVGGMLKRFFGLDR